MLPGLAFNTPDPDKTPDVVCDANPEVEVPSFELTDPSVDKTFLLVLFESFVLGSVLPISRPCLETSGNQIQKDKLK